jgi:hypothetical protein
MLQAGFTSEEASQAAIFKGMDLDSANKIKNFVKLPSDSADDTPEYKEKPLPKEAATPKAGDGNHGRFIDAARSRSEAKARGGRGINTLYVCKATKSSGSFKEGFEYIAYKVDSANNPVLARARGRLAGNNVSNTDKSNFSRKFKVLSGHDLDMYLNALEESEIDSLLENTVIREEVARF